MLAFLVWFSLLPFCCLFHSPSPRLVLHDFRLSLNDEFFNQLVAHRVGIARDEAAAADFAEATGEA